MNQEQHITKHQKGKHLTFLDRAIIQVRLKDKWSPYRIAKEIGCSPNTVRNEIRRGTPELYWGTKDPYDACIAQSVYESHRINSHRTPSFHKARKFLKTVELRFKENHWSFDACVGYSKMNREFSRSEMVCTKTLYNYQERGSAAAPHSIPVSQNEKFASYLVPFSFENSITGICTRIAKEKGPMQ